MPLGTAEYLDFRKQIAELRQHNNKLLPRYYHWAAHVVVNFVLIASAFVWNISLLQNFRIREFLMLSILFVCWAVVEYAIHRFILHGTFFSKTRLYIQHSHFHHGYFSEDLMCAAAPIDVNRVLLFPIDVVALLMLNALLSFGLFVLVNHEIGILFSLAGVLYLFMYELCHGLCHLTWSYRIPYLRKMAEHHKTHHAFYHGGHSHYSIVIPWLDTLFSSLRRSTSNEKNRDGEHA